MRIAIFSDNFYPEMSGISDSIITLAKELVRDGHYIRFYAPRYSKKNYEIVGLQPHEIDLGKNISVKRFFSFSYPSSPTKQARLVIPTLWRWFDVKKFQPDIIYSQLFFGVGLEALIAAKILKIKFVGTSHTPIGEFINYSPVQSKWFTNLSLRYVNWYYGKCDVVTTPSHAIIKEMKKKGFKKDAVVISNPIDLSHFTHPPKEKKEELKKKFGLLDFTIISVGRLAPEKHIDDIIKAFELAEKNIPHISLVLTGRGSAEGDLKALARKLNLEKKIKFVGYVDFQCLVELYQASDAFVVASTAEAQCISMMQAMAAGLPVIATRAHALPEYVNDQNGYLVEPHDFKKIAEILVDLFNNPARRESLGRGGREFVEKFSIANIANEWKKLFNVIIERKKSP